MSMRRKEESEVKMVKKRRHQKKATRHRRRQPTLTKSTVKLTKLAVTGLVGAGVIATTGAAIKNIMP